MISLSKRQEVSDWVQYHNVGQRGWPAEPTDDFRVFWTKPVTPPVGARLWLVAGEPAKPTYKYYLIEWFLIDRINFDEESRRYIASGRRGKYLGKRSRLDGESWFPQFKRCMAKFSRGLSQISDPMVIKRFEKIAARSSRKDNHRVPAR